MGLQNIFIDYDISSETLLTQGVFKCIDFGLAFSVEEDDLHQVIIIIIIIINNVIIIIFITIMMMIGVMGLLHQIQSSGYRAPESAAWNKHKVLPALTINAWMI